MVHRCMAMSYDTSPTVMLCDKWYITCHRCMVMSYDTSPTIDVWSCCDTSSTIDAWPCHMLHHLPSMHGHVIWYITFHRCMVMSCDTSPTIDAWSFHIMHHLPSMHVNITWCLIMLYDTVMSYNASPTVYGIYLPYDTSSTIDAWPCHMIHHLASMHDHASMVGDVSYDMVMHRW